MARLVTVCLLLVLSTSTLFHASPAVAQDGTLVAIAVTPSNDGILTVPVGGDAAFALAVLNVGTAGVWYYPIPTASAWAESEFSAMPVSLPLTLTICKTDASGHCQPNTIPAIAPGVVHTYSVFVHADGPVGLAPPYAARIVVTFHGTRPITVPSSPPGPAMAPYASTSVALRTIQP